MNHASLWAQRWRVLLGYNGIAFIAFQGATLPILLLIYFQHRHLGHAVFSLYMALINLAAIVIVLVTGSVRITAYVFSLIQVAGIIWIGTHITKDAFPWVSAVLILGVIIDDLAGLWIFYLFGCLFLAAIHLNGSIVYYPSSLNLLLILTVAVGLSALYYKISRTFADSQRFARTLLGMVSHDLASPLSAIELAVRRISKIQVIHDGAQNEVDRLKDASVMIRDMIENVSKVVNAQSQLQAFRTEEFIGLPTLIDNVRRAFKPMMEQKNLQLVVEGMEGKEKLKIRGNPVVISTHIFGNILSNAIKFSFPNSTIYLRVRVEDEKILIGIEDQGVGMSQETVEALLRGNLLSSSAGTKGERGHAIGLSVVSYILLNIGASYRIQSQRATPNKSGGTCFEIGFNRYRS